jgi:hypothetical protein
LTSALLNWYSKTMQGCFNAGFPVRTSGVMFQHARGCKIFLKYAQICANAVFVITKKKWLKKTIFSSFEEVTRHPETFSTGLLPGASFGK